MTSVETTYFEETGGANTDAVLAIAKKRADELDVDAVVVASTTGTTAVKAARLFKGQTLVVVSHCAGFKGPNTQELTDENRKLLRELGVSVHTATHALGGIGRAIRREYKTMQVDEIVGNTLRLLGHGLKVACEISAMAADAGLVRTDREVVAIAGSSRGADTAIVVQPANVHDFFALRIKEILCKPRL